MGWAGLGRSGRDGGVSAWTVWEWVSLVLVWNWDSAWLVWCWAGVGMFLALMRVVAEAPVKPLSPPDSLSLLPLTVVGVWGVG